MSILEQRLKARGIAYEDLFGWEQPSALNKQGGLSSATRLQKPTSVPDHVSFGKVHSKATALNAEYLEMLRN